MRNFLLKKDDMVYTVKELAKILGISESALWKLIDMGRIEVVRIGCAVRIPQEEAERLQAWFWRDKLYLSINDVAHLLKVSYKTVYRKIRRGFLPARKINGRYLIHPDDLDRLLLSPDERCP